MRSSTIEKSIREEGFINPSEVPVYCSQSVMSSTQTAIYMKSPCTNEVGSKFDGLAQEETPIIYRYYVEDPETTKRLLSEKHSQINVELLMQLHRS